MVTLIGSVLVAVAATVHVALFFLESVLFSSPGVWRRFGLGSQEDADVVRRITYHQGFYNLFLAGGALLGLVFRGTPLQEAGIALILFSTACMVLAGLVLLVTGRRYLVAATVQGLPALAALALILVGLAH